MSKGIPETVCIKRLVSMRVVSPDTEDEGYEFIYETEEGVPIVGVGTGDAPAPYENGTLLHRRELTGWDSRRYYWARDKSNSY